MITVHLVLLVLAFFAFAAAAIGVPAARPFSLVPLGLALWVLSLLIA